MNKQESQDKEQHKGSQNNQGQYSPVTPLERPA